jgi:hypothetical protein
MVNPKVMCRKHLLGEHVEHHMFIGTLRKGKKIDKYLTNNLLEPLSLYKRHKEISLEMIRRGYNHNSPLSEIDACIVLYLKSEQLTWKIDKGKAAQDLIRRCPECKKNFKRRKG